MADQIFTLSNLRSYKLSLQATISHYGLYLYCGHYTASGYCCNKTFYCNDENITVCYMKHTHRPPPPPTHTYTHTHHHHIYHNVWIYKLLVDWVYSQNTEGRKYLPPWCHLIKFMGNRLRESVRWTMCFLLMTSGLVPILNELHMICF